MTGTYAIPAAELLSHGQVQLSARLHYFNTLQVTEADTAADSAAVPDTTEHWNLPYASEILIGVENRAEVGFQYGDAFSVSFKALLLNEDVYWPAVVVGVRNLFNSQEGRLYGLKDKESLRKLRGEAYFTLGKRLGDRTGLHLGLSVWNQTNKSLAGINAALEQALGGGAYVAYEVFERFADFHHSLGFEWRWGGVMSMSLAMTEFQSWVRQKGRWGLFLNPAGSGASGYNSPGVRFAVHLNGRMPIVAKKTIFERVSDLETRHDKLAKEKASLEDSLGKLKLALDSLKTMAASPRPPEAPGPGPHVDSVAGLLLAMEAMISSDTAFDPAKLQALARRIFSLGRPGAEALRRIALDSAAEEAMRLRALFVMGQSRDSSHAPSLALALKDSSPRMRREAVSALGKVGGQGALDLARGLVQDADAAVALAAREAVEMLENARTSGRAP